MIKHVALSEVLSFYRGITFKPEDKVDVGSDNSVVCLRTKNIQKVLDESDLLAVPDSFVKHEHLYVKPGDILISTANSWELVGKCVRVQKTIHKSTIGGFISLLRPKTNLIDADYLYRFLSMEETQFKIRRLGKKTTNISNMDRVRFLNLQIPLPPIKNQKKIADILEKADQLRKDCQQMNQELNNLAQSVFFDMFGDPVSNPKGWETTKLSKLVSVISGATPSKSNDSYWNGDIPWVSPKDMKVREISDSIDHVSESAFQETNLKSIEVDSILIVVRGMILAHTVPLAITRKVISINQDIKALSVKSESISSEFLLSVLAGMHSHLLNLISTSAHGTKKMEMDNLMNLNIIIPSKETQKKYISILSNIGDLICNCEKELELYQNNYNALMQKAFKGELQLKEPVV